MGAAARMTRMPYRCLTLLTDYGYSGGFVGILHAVAFSIAPSVPVIHVDHGIPAHDVRLGALRLERMIPYVPEGVHVAVVDPGVGGPRRPVAIEAGGRVFVGPDNGLCVWAARRAGAIERVVVLDDERFWLPHRSRTFDGRDIFVPVAAHLAAGAGAAAGLLAVGSEIDPSTLVEIERPSFRPGDDGSVVLEVVQIDAFGNVQLSGDAAAADALGWRAGDQLEVTAGEVTVPALFGAAFGDVAVGDAVVLLDSDGCLALSVNKGSAAGVLETATGAPASGAPGDPACPARPGDLVSVRRRQQDRTPRT